jgi:DNA-binding MarR family transcriptional regulator
MSSALLSRRLKQLEYKGVIERSPLPSGRGNEYRLTEAGYELFPVLNQMGMWAQKWLKHDVVADENTDPNFYMWELRRIAIVSGRTVKERKVIRFQLDGVPVKNRFYWLVLEPEDVDICVRNPGYEVDLQVRASMRTLIAIRLGDLSFTAAIEKGTVTLEGDTVEANALPRWFAKGIRAFRGE